MIQGRFRDITLVVCTCASSVVMGCGLPSERSVADEFIAARRDTVAITNIYPGEGNNDAVYWHIFYKTASDSVYHAVWLYERDRTGRFIVTDKTVRHSDEQR